MLQRKLPRRTVFGLGLPLCLTGCASDGSTETEPEIRAQRVELISWWIAASEADALEALIDVHTSEYPHESISNAGFESAAAARVVLEEKLAAGQPPDVVQESAALLGTFLADNPHSLVPLSEFFAAEGLSEVIIAEVLADVTVDGEIYAMPVNIHRENALLYNAQIFAEHKLEVPTTLEELLGVCAQLKAAGVTPIAASQQGWIVRLMFHALASATLGAQEFKRYFSGESAMNEGALRAAADHLDDILTNYVNASASDPAFGWTDAADLLLEGKAAMFIHGDWAKGYLSQLGWEAGTGFGVVGMPGAADLFLYALDIFVLPVGSPEPEAAKNFLRTVASSPGQAAFNRLKGSTPIRIDTNPAELDAVGQATLDELRNAGTRMLGYNKAVWEQALADFVVSRDKDALLAVYLANPPGK